MNGTTARVLAFGLALAVPVAVSAAGLRGSASSMESQHEVAVDEHLTFLDNPAQVRELVASGGLEEIAGNADFSLSKVSFPYARPEVKLFVERLAAQHYRETGERLVITSLTRPVELQPRNAHELSVHPAGMAVDFRVPSSAQSRTWLEKALLGLERSGVLDVTREHHPSHYHVAVFPAEYLAYVEKRKPAEAEASRVSQASQSAAIASSGAMTPRADIAAVSAPPAETPSSRRIAGSLLIFALAGVSGSVAVAGRRRSNRAIGQ